MDEPYCIEVLNIINPHIIFVESKAQKDEPVIQQVGLYGVLPVSKTIDIDGVIVAERCENWPVAANTILREFLADNNQLYFVPMHVDERSTIFDENIPQFGDIIIKSKKSVSITDHLIKSAVAEKDECTFLQKLSSGSLKLKLSQARTDEVCSAIKKYYQKHRIVKHDWQKTINKQTTVYQETKRVTAELTKENLKLLESNSLSNTDVMKIMERKEKDLNLCKDVDLVSVGRATNRRSRPTSATPSKILTNVDHKLSPKNTLSNIKQYLDTYGKKDQDNKHRHSVIENKINLSKPNKDVIANDPPNIKADNSIENDHDWDDSYECVPGVAKFKPKHELPEKIRQKQIKQEHDQFLDEKNKQNSTPNKNYQDLSYIKPRIHMKVPEKCLEEINNKYDAEKVLQHGKFKTISPMKPKERHLVYCPDMEMSTDNLKKLVPITVREDSDANYVYTGEEKDIKPTLDDQANHNLSHKNKGKSNKVTHSNSDEKNYAQTNKSANKASRLNFLQPQMKLQELKNSQKNANTSMSSNSDVSSDQIDFSPKSSKTENVSIKISPHFKSQCLNSAGTFKNSSILSNPMLQDVKSAKKVAEKSSSTSDTSAKDTSSSTKQSQIEPELAKLNAVKAVLEPKPVEEICKIDLNIKHAENISKIERHVNPFKNLDGNKSVFVEKLVTPILMVHTKNNNVILPKCELRDVPFKADIQMKLKSLRVNVPKRLQTVTWSYILRGHSMFIIGPAGNGKTLGYVPAICNLVSDAKTQFEGVGPICIIVCATALSVSEVESYCKKFLSVEEQIVTFYSGIDPTNVTTSLLNGCHVLICTAPALVTLLETDFGVDLRRLGILVLDDCERLSQVYVTEVNKITTHVNAMLKNRADKAFKVQYIVASRLWCDFMTPLAKKAPDTIIAIGASQECVLYSKTKTSVSLVNSKEKKMDLVFAFLEQIDCSKRTVIVCREDEEVESLESILTSERYTVFKCNSTMTLHDLYKLNEAWANYQEPISGPILVCCDGNLAHLNITNASYLVHFSLPPLFSMFCKRFSVLNENYASIFAPPKEEVKIKVLLDQTNIEQLPKIIHFIKRCTKEALPDLDDVLQEVLETRDFKKAEILTPICNNLLMLGECVDFWNCSDRHTVFNKFDEPKDWIPKQGVITFKITQFDSAVTYSARVLSKITKTDTIKYPNNYNTLSMKIGMHYSKEINRKLHGVPKVGDICAVALKQNLFERCKVMKVIPSDKKNSNHVLINLLDEEKMTVVSDVQLYYLPEDLKTIETYIVKVRLANIQPKDRDVTFSVAAKDHLQQVTDRDRENGLYMRGKVVMTLGNCIFVETAEACVDLTSLGETVVKRNFKNELLDRHAEPNPNHIEKLKKISGIIIKHDVDDESKFEAKHKMIPKWAHLSTDDFTTVILGVVIDANTIFLRQTKFQEVMDSLQKDIEKYVEKAHKINQEELIEGNIVLAEFPDDKTYERARIDQIIDKKANCFFVDNGDWREVAIDRLKPITDNILHRIPFQVIECRLVGVKPPGNADVWPEFTTCWLDDNCFEDKQGKQKQLYAKYFTKESATVTNGHKYGVVLIDTSDDEDVVINKMMIELNLAKEIEEEQKYIDEPLNFTSMKGTVCSFGDEAYSEYDSVIDKNKLEAKDLIPFQRKPNYDDNTSDSVPLNVLLGKPIRSMPLIDSDNESELSDKWDVDIGKEFLGSMFPHIYKTNITGHVTNINADIDAGNAASDELQVNTKATRITSSFNTIDKTKVPSCDSTLINNGSLKIVGNENNTPSKSPSLDSDIDVVDERSKEFDIFKRKMCSHDESSVDTEKNNEDKSVNDTLDSDDFSSSATDFLAPEIAITVNNCDLSDPYRTPKLIWRQNKSSVTLKINLIGVVDYSLDVKEKHIKFETWHNDTKYKFEFELYGIILPQKCVHSNKGQYILVKLFKMMTRNWLNLTKDFSTKKWIAYDVDAIDLSSGSDDSSDDEGRKAIKYDHEKFDSSSEDEEQVDDLNINYK